VHDRRPDQLPGDRRRVGLAGRIAQGSSDALVVLLGVVQDRHQRFGRRPSHRSAH
jgi:hypothetical protein